MILARKMYAYGGTHEYWDEKECIGEADPECSQGLYELSADPEMTGWTRIGHPSHSHGAGLAVVLNASYASYTSKRMHVGRQHAGEHWTDILSWAWGRIPIDSDGWGTFPVGPRSVSVWVDEKAEGRQRMEKAVSELSVLLPYLNSFFSNSTINLYSLASFKPLF